MIERERGARDRLIADGERRRVEQMLDAGYSVSKISKITRITYTHVKRLAIQYQGDRSNGQDKERS